MKLRKRPRRRIQRAFYQWLNLVKETLPFPISIIRRNERLIECRFAGLTSSIRIVLTYDLCVVCDKEGKWWDILACFDAIPEKVNGSYVCALCSPRDRTAYATRAEFWHKEMFEPFLIWIKDTLSTAEWLAFHQITQAGSVWIELGAGSPPDYIMVERLRTPPSLPGASSSD